MIDRWSTSTQFSNRRSTATRDSLRLRARSPEHIVESFLNHFRRDPCPSRWQRFYFDDDDDVGDGVTREHFSLFWGAVVDRLFHSQGGDLSLPTLTPIYNAEIWETVERILAFTLAVLGNFPFDCIPQILCQFIFHQHHEIDPDALVQTFLRSLGERQRNPLAPLVSGGDIVIAEYIRSRRQDLLDLLREFNVPALPTTDQARSDGYKYSPSHTNGSSRCCNYSYSRWLP